MPTIVTAIAIAAGMVVAYRDLTEPTRRRRAR